MAKDTKAALSDVREAVTTVGGQVGQALGQRVADSLEKLVKTTIEASKIQEKEEELRAQAQQAVKMLAVTSGRTSNGPLDTRQKSEFEKKYEAAIRELNNLNLKRTEIYKEQKNIIKDAQAKLVEPDAETPKRPGKKI